MLEYRNLSPLEFEYVCQDIMQAMLQIPLRRFAPGKDGGIDLVDDLSNPGVIVQVKHYINSPYAALKQALKAELPKIRKQNPKQYFICCSQQLSPRQTKEIYQIFTEYMPSERNIVSLLEIDRFLCDPQNSGLLRKHFKLWLSATNILSELYNQDIFVDSQTLLYDVEKELPYYVQTDSYWKGKAVLESERLLMLVGNPGVGKTTVSKMLLLYFASIGYRVRYTTNGELADVKRSISADPEQKEIILLDDCLGQCYFRLRDTQENELSALIKYVRYHPNKCLLLNSRITIFNEAREHSPEFSQLFDRGVIPIRCIDAEEIPPQEKALILYALMRKFQVPDQYYQSIRKNKNYRTIVAHANYNPRIIEYAAWRHQDAGQPDDFFAFVMDKIERPQNVWKDEFERRMDRVDRYFMYTLYSLSGPNPYVEVDVLQRAFQGILQAIGADISVNQFENVLARLSRSLVRIVSRQHKILYTREPYYNLLVPTDSSREITVLNPSVNDYLREVFRSPVLREFFKQHACYVEQVIHMCETEEEVEDEVRKLAEDGRMMHMQSVHPDYSPAILLFFVVRLGLLDACYEPYILPGLQQFPTHYYVSRAFMLSHQKYNLIHALWQESFFSFYRIADKVNAPEGVKALCSNLDVESLVKVGNMLNHTLVFAEGWKREAFVAILRDELQDAGQYYLDGKTLNYDEEGMEVSFQSYCVDAEDELYDCLYRLEVEEIDPLDFEWDMAEWERGNKENSEMEESHGVGHYEENEVDLILDRPLE